MDYSGLLPMAFPAAMALGRLVMWAWQRRRPKPVAAEPRPELRVIVVVPGARRGPRRVYVRRGNGQRPGSAPTRNSRKEAPPSEDGASTSSTAPPSMPTSPRV
nr:hypothetical protein GCM10020063_079980 [Dactylosporangium thailandense]